LIKMVNNYKKGFTLIELLIVMAILGVLAVVVLVAINPVQQLARTRDTGRKSAVTQMGRTLQAYFTGRNGKYLMTTTPNCTLATGWITCLVAAGELRSAPSGIAYRFGSNCTGGTVPIPNYGAQNGWCYSADVAGGVAVVYATLESKAESSKCDTVGDVPFFVWSSANGSACLRCMAPGVARPNPGVQPCNSKQ
jgi:prepilin-type N-terminal cleavage/methylation domain-containing protein